MLLIVEIRCQIIFFQKSRRASLNWDINKILANQKNDSALIFSATNLEEM